MPDAKDIRTEIKQFLEQKGWLTKRGGVRKPFRAALKKAAGSSPSPAGVKKWLDGGGVDRKWMQGLHSVLEVKVSIQEMGTWNGWADKESRSAKSQLMRQPHTFTEALEQLDPCRLRQLAELKGNPDRHSPDKGLKKSAGQALANVFATMGVNHFIVATTVTLPPSAFRRKEKEYRDLIKAAYEAMYQGLLFGFIIPNKKITDILAKYTIEPTWTPEQLHKGFKDFALGYKEFLAERKQTEASTDEIPLSEYRAGERMQLFEWGEFPMTPCGRTVSLIGEAPKIETGHNRRVLERNASLTGELGLTDKDTGGEEDLRHFIDHVIGFGPGRDCWSGGTPESWIPLTTDKNDEEDARWFANELHRRMLGRPGPVNQMGRPRPASTHPKSD